MLFLLGVFRQIFSIQGVLSDKSHVFAGEFLVVIELLIIIFQWLDLVLIINLYITWCLRPLRAAIILLCVDTLEASRFNLENGLATAHDHVFNLLFWAKNDSVPKTYFRFTRDADLGVGFVVDQPEAVASLPGVRCLVDENVFESPIYERDLTGFVLHGVLHIGHHERVQHINLVELASHVL